MKKRQSEKKPKKEEEEESYLDGDDSKANISVSKSDINSKKQSSTNMKDEWRCLDCQKCYKSYPAFYTHNKLKHGGQPPKNYDIPRSLEDIRKDRGRPRVTDTNQRIKFTVQDKHQQRCEDNLYEFLGKLGQKGDDNGQKENTVIRGYLQQTLDPVEKFPIDLFPQQGRANYEIIQQEIKILNDELLRNLDQWEFIDPLDLKPDDMSEFSIYNLKSLFYNLHNTKKMSNKYTTLCVFLIWISKVLLDEAYREICLLTVIYIEKYWILIEGITERNNQEEPLALQARRERNTFKEEFLQNSKKNLEGVYDKLKIFSEVGDIKLFIDKFMAWYYHFDDEQIFDGAENKEISEGLNDHEDLDDDLENEVSESGGGEGHISGESEDLEEDADQEEEPKAKKKGGKASKKQSKAPAPAQKKIHTEKMHSATSNAPSEDHASQKQSVSQPQQKSVQTQQQVTSQQPPSQQVSQQQVNHHQQQPPTHQVSYSNQHPQGQIQQPQGQIQQPQGQIQQPQGQIQQAQGQIQLPQGQIQIPQGQIQQSQGQLPQLQGQILQPQGQIHIQQPQTHIPQPHNHISQPHTHIPQPHTKIQQAHSQIQQPLTQIQQSPIQQQQPITQIPQIQQSHLQQQQHQLIQQGIQSAQNPQQQGNQSQQQQQSVSVSQGGIQSGGAQNNLVQSSAHLFQNASQQVVQSSSNQKGQQNFLQQQQHFQPAAGNSQTLSPKNLANKNPNSQGSQQPSSVSNPIYNNFANQNLNQFGSVSPYPSTINSQMTPQQQQFMQFQLLQQTQMQPNNLQQNIPNSTQNPQNQIISNAFSTNQTINPTNQYQNENQNNHNYYIPQSNLTQEFQINQTNHSSNIPQIQIKVQQETNQPHPNNNPNNQNQHQ